MLNRGKLISRRVYYIHTATGNPITIETDVRKIIPEVSDPRDLYQYVLYVTPLYVLGIGDQDRGDLLYITVGPPAGLNQLASIDDYGTQNQDDQSGVSPNAYVFLLDELSINGIYADFVNWAALETHNAKLLLEVYKIAAGIAYQEGLIDRSS